MSQDNPYAVPSLPDPSAGSPPPVYGTPPADPHQPTYGAPDPYAAPGYSPYSAPDPGPAVPGYPQAPGYGASYPAPYGYANPYAVQGPKTNPMALTAMILGIVGLASLFMCGVPVLCIAALVLGIIGLKQIKRDGGNGRGMALAGVITGAVGTVLGIVLVAFIGVMFATTDWSSPSDTSSLGLVTGAPGLT